MHQANPRTAIPSAPEETLVSSISPEEATPDYFSSVVQSMSDSLVVIGPDGRIAAVNQATLQMLGYNAEELIGERPGILFAKGTRGTGLETLHERGIVQRGEKVLITKDGHEIPVFYSGSVLRSASGKVEGIVAVMHDATKQKQLEQHLRDALRQQQELVQLKSQFVSTVSHEFRTPLAIIQANSEMMHRFQDRMNPQQEAACFDQVQAQIRHMVTLLEGSLTLEKMHSGEVDFQPVPSDVDQICRQLVATAQGRVRRNFSYHCDEDLPRVKIDAKLFKQMLTNLLSNAIKFSSANSQITLQIRQENEQLILEICDQGIGIPEAEQDSLFDPFFRASNVGTINGTGLGLAMAQMAAQMHGGEIHIDSQEDAGTCVSVTLPFKSAAYPGQRRLA